MTLLAAVVTHVWQSTLFAAAIGLVTLALRRNGAAVRHALWLTASLKFLVPFAALMALGAQLAPPRRPHTVTTEIVFVNAARADTEAFFTRLAPRLEPAADTVTPLAAAAVIWSVGVLAVVAVWAVRWRRLAAIARGAAPVETGREVDALRRIERAVGVWSPIRLAQTDSALEPGVFGVRRPILVWPRAINEHLDERQLATILAHEVAHVRRRDNLAAMLQMAVTAIFWFHPLVWWLGARLVDERERACDEAVVRLGHEPRVYAETILTACRLFLESPLACVSGVTGSDLSKRIERIMHNVTCEALTPLKKALVSAVPAAAVFAPFVVGVLNAPPVRAQQIVPAPGKNPEFEVASVKPNTSGMAGKVSIQTQPGGRFTAENVTGRQLIRFAYQLQDSQLSGGPKWLDDDRFDIVAKAEGDDLGEPFLSAQSGPTSRAQLMLRSLLADRFKLVVHTEAREQATYALVAARRDSTLGPQLRRSTLDCSMAADARRPAPSAGPAACGIRMYPGHISAGGAGLGQLANGLANLVGRLVFDRTGLTGSFDFTLTFAPEQMPSGGYDKKAAALGLPPVDPNGPSIFTALQEQLGLKLDAQKDPVDTLFIDRVEHPVEN